MADQEISRPGGPVEVTIPAHPRASRAEEVRVRLSREAAREYGVWQKEMPEEMPDSYQGRPITWLNNFGLKPRGSDAYAASVPAYTIVLAKGPEDAVLVVYEPQGDPPLRELATREVDGQVQATLDRGDPSVGWAG